jgi:hypothetical protein
MLLVVAATTYFIATRKSEPLHQSVSPPTEIDSVSPAPIAPPVEPISSTQESDESIPIPIPEGSTEERAAAVKHTLTLGMGPERDAMSERLVAQGLSRVDAEKVAQRFVEGYADCLFDATRRQYESQGTSLNEFLEHAERSWTQLLAAFQLNRVRSRMASCMANISQQTGIPLGSPDYASGGSFDDRITPPPPLPSWAAEMDSRIRDHVASRPDLGVTDVLIECREEGCSVMLVGRDIRIFEFEFDVFAQQNGFQKAVLRGDSTRRLVWLER